MATLDRFLICDSVSATGKRISITKPLTDSASDDTVYLSEALNVNTTQLNKCDYVAITVPNANNTAHETIACTKANYNATTFTMSSCTRGVIGYGSTISSDSNLIAKHEAGAEISVPVLVQDHVARQEVLDGERATNANSFQIGDGTATEQLIKANQGLANDSAYGFDASGDPIIYKADGSSFVPGAGAGAISGGDGIDITASVISVDLGTDSGLEIDTNKLEAKVKASGGITKDSDGLSVNTADFVADIVDDTAYDESTWNGVTDVAPSKNAVRDKFESSTFSKLIGTDVTEVSVTNTTSETNLFSVSVPGGLLGTDRALRFKLNITDHDHDASDILSIDIKYGASSMAVDVGSPSTDDSNFVGYIEGTIIASGATGSQLVSANFLTRQTNISGITTGEVYHYTNNTTFSIDSTAAQTFTVSAQWNNARTNNKITTKGAYLEII